MKNVPRINLTQQCANWSHMSLRPPACSAGRATTMDARQTRQLGRVQTVSRNAKEYECFNNCVKHVDPTGLVTLVNPLTGKKLRALGQRVQCPITGALLIAHTSDGSVEVARKAKRQSSSFSRSLWKERKGELDIAAIQVSDSNSSIRKESTNVSRVPMSRPTAIAGE